MKTLKTVLSLSIALIMVFSLCACSIKIGGEETWEYSAEDKEGCVKLFNDFFAKTFENTNMVVTEKGNGNLILTETIDGTSDYITYAATNTDTYSFIKDGEYLYATAGDDMNYYMAGEEYYGYGYKVYKNSINLLDDISEGEATFNCEVKGSKLDDASSQTLTLEVKTDEGSVTITASSENDLVKSITVVTVDEGETRTTDMTFEYGSASVTVPDITDWYKMEA